MVVIDLRSPERAWGPFMEWLRSQGVKPDNCCAIDVDEEAMRATVTEFKRDMLGKKVVRDGAVVRKERRVRISSLPPLHPSRVA